MPEASDTSRKAEDNELHSDEPQPLPTINFFEFWEDESQQAKALSALDFHYPMPM